MQYFTIMALILLSIPAMLTAETQPDDQSLIASVPPPILDGFTADPAIRVFGDTYYVYPTSDKHEWLTTDFSVWSSKDLITWKRDGMILDVTRELKWANIKAWAPDCIERNGKYYFYFCADGKIGVATADRPTGPFVDALGKPLVQTGGKVDIYTIDPHAFIDDDGQAYLYYGNGRCAQVFKLKPDMITLDGDPVDIPLKDFREAVWVFKRGGKCHFTWSIDDARSPDYRVGYGTSDSPLGPVKAAEKDFIVLRKNGNAIGTAHHSVLNVPGTDRWYVAYHRHAVPGGSGYQRQTCLVRMEFNDDGTIKPMDPLTAPFKPGDVGEPLRNGKGRPDAEVGQGTQKAFHDWAPTPPMGWNSWDCFGTAVTEAQTKQNADYMADKLLKHGWNLITVDIQWYEGAARGHDYVEGAPLTMDTNGRLVPASKKFPSSADGAGFKPLADYVHGKGLKFGIHLMRGVPRQAVREKTPILGTKYTAADIANVNDVCKWNPDMYGIDMSRPGAQAYYDSVFELIASWGVDFVKVDDLSRPYHDHVPEIEGIRRAIDKAGRPMVLSTSPGETPLDAAAHVTSHANLWRISDDFWDNWKHLYDQFARCRNWAKHQRSGAYPDADMLALGAVRVGQKNPWTMFTPDEQITHMTLWSIARSPLIFGGHLPQNDPWTLSLLTNDEVIAVNQQGRNPRELSDDNGLIMWVSDVPSSSDKYVAVFNTRALNDAAQIDGLPLPVRFDRLGLPTRCRVRDLWQRADVGTFDTEYVPVVRSHGARLLRVSPAAN